MAMHWTSRNLFSIIFIGAAISPNMHYNRFNETNKQRKGTCIMLQKLITLFLVIAMFTVGAALFTMVLSVNGPFLFPAFVTMAIALTISVILAKCIRL